MLELPIVGIYEVRILGIPQWHDVNTKFIQILSAVLELNHAERERERKTNGQMDGQTDKHRQPYLRLFHSYLSKKHRPTTLTEITEII
jgi:hypothetical protein